ncbi:type II toxin-antitoxin system RelE/ParE family toxin [Acaryochloris sp. IP29b_bin.148]|uniref:type II toxin-antitoxin system RelE family toxin n=1 Tax=Acaryochloris sp. IP29b_bin.148 TaxID=2969218 RepID=UPI002621E8B6|nr:type II toxin-antitoxin system RelE/ParE family toxin [Acaryochloris sp. IP29b_bin.148]
MDYRIELTELALEMMGKVRDRREQQGIIQRIQKLTHEPIQQGKPLTGDLKGLYSIRAVGQRYRIVYQVKVDQVLVIVVGVGRRKDGDKKDVYRLLKKLLGDSLAE